MKRQNYSIFKTCINGHDMSAEGAYVYESSGRRSCRQCAVDSKKIRKERKKKGSFA